MHGKLVKIQGGHSYFLLKEIVGTIQAVFMLWFRYNTSACVMPLCLKIQLLDLTFSTILVFILFA